MTDITLKKTEEKLEKNVMFSFCDNDNIFLKFSQNLKNSKTISREFINCFVLEK